MSSLLFVRRLGVLAAFMVSLVCSYAETFDIFEVFSFHLTLACLSPCGLTLSVFVCLALIHLCAFALISDLVSTACMVLGLLEPICCVVSGAVVHPLPLATCLFMLLVMTLTCFSASSPVVVAV